MDVKTKSKNYETSILFMQQEHANTLKALHNEISKLQQRCSELTFQVAMNSTYTNQEDAYRDKADGFESDLKTYKKTVADLKEDLQNKDKRSRLLEEQLKAQERKYKSELKGKDNIILSMQHELETKANSITTMTMKYRDLKQHVRASREKSARARSATQPEPPAAPAVVSPREYAGVSPAPPKEGAPRQQRHHHRRSSGHAALPQSAVKNRPPSSRKLEDRPGSGNSSDSMPDPTPFLRLTKSEKPGVRRSERAILPPIISSTAESGGLAAAVPVLLPATGELQGAATHHRPRHHPHHHPRGGEQRGSPASSSPEYEVETLAVDQVKDRRDNLRRAREYNTSSDC